ncbi:methylmalonyl Co-A mutase-associated GTPase MeaB [Insolitispirillum peregrinum]|uniref:Methylmalonyl-CoA mutase metallochaperone MeaB n=1 Tax=Insolitispirillum peregrinum TaxID=80876 RepID=A0A1N7IT23_9PROT|nr:methylmalonyl Co-A mutase-associated GTPase MeaB [Insolitispirillum peregrinum]SIS40111.1 methylmalonyl-CoA mutase metallochaperone MeaB [Insolitispirillum peregrinum]
MLPKTADDYVNGVLAGNRAIIGRAITLIESRAERHRALAKEVLMRLVPHSGKAHRIGISGVPGVGKSTFIETFGTNLTGAGHKVAVLAVDPTSSRTGGSILGDKTRMAKLSTDENAFIRPSPTGGYLGGVARATRETMIVLEAAGFDVVLVETVGTGQSETLVADMVDFYLVLMLPGAGDELQGIKKGILELADMIAVNKCEGDNDRRALAARVEYKNALNIMTPASPNWKPPVVTISGLNNYGIDTLWEKIQDHRKILTDSGELPAKRREQQITWMWSMLKERLVLALERDPAVAERIPSIEHDVAAGTMTATVGAETLLRAFGLDLDG